MKVWLIPQKKPFRHGVPAMLVVVFSIWSSFAAASATRPPGPRCGAQRPPTGHRLHLRCGLRPNTVISLDSPAGLAADSTASFKFFSTRPGSRFRCRLDGRAWTPCKSPATYAELKPGTRRFSVRAIGSNRLADLTPATVEFTVGPEPSSSAHAAVGDPRGPDGADLPDGFDPDRADATEGGAPDPAGDGSNLPQDAPVRAADEGAPFASSGVWAEGLLESEPVDPQSPQLIATLVAKVEEERAAGTGPRLGADTRTPLYRVAAGQARVPVFLDTGPWGDRLAAKLAAGVPIPPGAEPVAGSDRALAVWQAATDLYWEFFRLQQALHGPQFARSPKVSDGCGLAPGSYAYEVTAFNDNGETPVEGGHSGATVAVGACVKILWSPVHGAIGYRVYRSLNGSPASYLTTVPAGQSYLVDDGTQLPTGTSPPATNTASTPGQWHAAYGGLVEGVSGSPGYYRDLVEAGAVKEQANWGAAATGLPLAAGLVTREDVERGSVDHALAIGLANRSGSSIVRADSFAFPAQRSDGRSASPDSIPEGARLRLDPGLDLDSLGLSPFARMLAEAAQRFGMIVQDGSRSTVIYAEDPAPFMRAGQPNFYETRYGRGLSAAVAAFPWDRLEVLRMHLCQQSPCSSG